MDNIFIKSIEDFKINKKYDVVIINTFFNLQEINIPYKKSTQSDNKYINSLVDKISFVLNKNGLIFVYGITQELINFAVELNKKFIFKYWIVLDNVRLFENEDLPHNHIGLLVYSSCKDLSLLTPNEVRIPYRQCSKCGLNVKDWGGKKHLMNIAGTALSDVWNDFEKVINTAYDPQVSDILLTKINPNLMKETLESSLIPDIVLNRIKQICNTNNYLKVELSNEIRPIYKKPIINPISLQESISYDKYTNKIFLQDCISFLENINMEYPNGYFDLIFADPPYNLVKNYNDHDDSMSEEDYIQWSNKWLELCAKSLKQNGSMYVLNIPKWSIYHANELNNHLYLKNWIVWDALSTPMGKIMPAHYSLLYYVKNPNNYTFNQQFSTESKNLCVRNKCVKSREHIYKKIGDIWSDIHRIKHKKDRDEHPCQLPLKLMDRIISMSSNEGDIIFDPFCGAGTTPIIAKQLKRKFCSTDISQKYVDITLKSLLKVEEVGFLQRNSVHKKKTTIFTKKEIELKVQELVIKHNRQITLDELLKESKFTKNDILSLYNNLSTPLKAGRRIL